MKLRELIDHLNFFADKYGDDAPVKLCVESKDGQVETPADDVGVCVRKDGSAQYVVIMSPDV